MQGGTATTWERPAAHRAERLPVIDAQPGGARLGGADGHPARVTAGLEAA